MLTNSLVVFVASLALGQQEAGKASTMGDVSSKAAPKVIEQFKAEAAEYDIRLDSRPKDKLVLNNEPLLRWDNPARTGEDGALFVWTLDGRPEVIGTIFTYRYRDVIRRKHEYHTLAAGPLTASFRGQRVWAPRTAGIKLQPIPEAPRPTASARERLTQMKSLAREFSASMEDTSGQQFQLRLLPQPLLRYEPAAKEVLDGALFSFSLGTDPEAILVLEAHVASDHARWQYALARFHYIDIKVSHRGREVWHATPLPDIASLDLGSLNYQDSVYATYHVSTEKAEK
jgi:hypothetical protein